MERDTPEKLGRFLDMAESDLRAALDQRDALAAELFQARALLTLAAGGRIVLPDSMIQAFDPKRTTVTVVRDEASAQTVITVDA